MAYRSRIEPHLLYVFRLLALLLTGAYTISMLLRSDAMRAELMAPYLVSVGRTAILIVYLSLPILERYLKGLYLPLAIVFMTFDAPLPFGGIDPGYVFTRNESLTNVAMVPLFILVVLVAWQYDFGAVILYVGLSVAIDLAVAIPVDPSSQQFEAIFLTLLIRSSIMLLIGYAVSELMKVQRRQHQELVDANIKIAHYANAIETLAASRERNRLARELHDTLAHSLTAAIIQLEAADSLWGDQEKTRQLMQGSIGLLRAGLTDTRRALEELRASPLDDLGLLLALHELAKNTQERTGKPVVVDIPERIETMHSEIEQVIYRVAQEALENVVRHACAQHVNLTLQTANDDLTLEIRDDGVGFDPQQTPRNRQFGLRGMLERTQVVGGRLTVDSAPGAGTSVRLEMKTGL